jgi:hypothetical protein
MAVLQWGIPAVTGAFLAFIAYLQWRTAEQRAALELFEHRYALFQAFREAVGQLTTASRDFDQQQETDFLEAKERAYFFFGDNVQRYLDELWQDIKRVRAADTEFPLIGPVGDQQTRATSNQARQMALDRIKQFENAGRPLFGQYMRFAQPIPQPIDLIAKMRDNRSDA